MRSIGLTSRRTLLTIACAATLLAAVPFAASAYTNVSVHVDIGNAPPPPTFHFYAPPREVYVEDRVYLVEAPAFAGVDCFHYGGYYWMFRDGYWYRSRSWRTRFVVISPRYVPTVIYSVPARQWKHHPNGLPERVRYAESRSGQEGGGNGKANHGGNGNENHGGNGKGNHGGNGKGGHGK
jgi:hypothetical protein